MSFQYEINSGSVLQAASVGDLEEVSRLVNNGVSVNAADYDGRSALVIT